MINRFFSMMDKEPFSRLHCHDRIAVGVSGGPDSMVLAYLLSCWSEEKGGPQIHILSVDHGLRAEAVDEVAHVKNVSENWPRSTHYILKWGGEKPAQRVQESARSARYGLMEAHCEAHGITALLLAHHRDDQSETVLFRLAKGSGLDGLTGIRPSQERGNLTLFRPLLDISKDDILAFCHEEEIPFVDDPSNEKEQYARVRLRRSRAVLEQEGLSSKRLAVTAKRMERARCALEFYSDKVYRRAAKNIESVRIVFDCGVLFSEPEETVLRVLMKAMEDLCSTQAYRPRMEKVESLLEDIMRQGSMKPRTLGGVIFCKRGDDLVLTLEGVK